MIKTFLIARRIRAQFIALALLSSMGISEAIASEPMRFVNIGTANTMGVYHPLGTAVCQLLNQKRHDTRLGCMVESTEGSVDNLNSIGNGELDLAIAQADTQLQAFIGTHIDTIISTGIKRSDIDGTSGFASASQNKQLRTIAMLHTESFTVVTRTHSGIGSIDDLIGKRISIGNARAGHQFAMQSLMQAKGWGPSVFSEVHGFSTAQQEIAALCSGEIDAYASLIGHPSGVMMQATNACDVNFISLSQMEIKAVIQHNPVYVKTTISADVYRGNKTTQTFGTRAALVSNAALDDKAAYNLAKSLVQNSQTIEALHPAFGDISANSLAATLATIPMHPGALNYYREAKLLK